MITQNVGIAQISKNYSSIVLTVIHTIEAVIEQLSLAKSIETSIKGRF